jgi:uncharacterized membrane protein HdeD (DUF308 family)
LTTPINGSTTKLAEQLASPGLVLIAHIFGTQLLLVVLIALAFIAAGVCQALPEANELAG